jgi:hypothetical protein
MTDVLEAVDRHRARGVGAAGKTDDLDAYVGGSNVATSPWRVATAR